MGARLEKTRTPGIYKRGGRYVVIYRDPDGRQRKRSAATLAEARDVKAALNADVARGEYRALSRITFADYAPGWIASYHGRTARGFRESTREDYRRALGLDANGEPLVDAAGRRQGALAYFGRMRLAEIEPRDVKAYAKSVADRGVSKDTVRLTVAPVRTLLATAHEEGLIRSNPAAGLRLAQAVELEPNADDERAKALTEEELAKLLGELPEEWRLFVEFLAKTGLRPSEALALQWRHVDFGRRRVKVRRSVNRGRVGPPKTRFGSRDVPLARRLAQDLWRARKATGDPGDDALVFTLRGEPVDRTAAYRVVKAAGARAGVPWAGLRTLRHTCASILFRRGLNAKQVQVWLGHHSPAFTLATYVHLLPDALPEPTFLDAIRASRAAPAPTNRSKANEVGS